LPTLPRTVLLVEDNAIIAMNTEALLEEVGVTQVVVASTVLEAITQAEAGQFEFAILDLKLDGGEDSLPVAVRLSELGVRFVFATGFGEAVELVENYGAAGVLSKPYRLEDLERILLM
jgi:ActR/RegA family two-component response regulator